MPPFQQGKGWGLFTPNRVKNIDSPWAGYPEIPRTSHFKNRWMKTISFKKFGRKSLIQSRPWKFAICKSRIRNELTIKVIHAEGGFPGLKVHKTRIYGREPVVYCDCRTPGTRFRGRGKCRPLPSHRTRKTPGRSHRAGCIPVEGWARTELFEAMGCSRRRLRYRKDSAHCRQSGSKKLGVE
jgi:hypothetical protein